MFTYAPGALAAVFTAFWLLLSTVSCAVQPQQEASLPAPGIPVEAEAPRAVNILQSMPEMSLPLQQAVERYAATKESPPFHIQTVAGEDYYSALHSRLLSGEQVDLFHLTGPGDAARLSPYLEDLGRRLPWIKTASSGTLEAVTVGGCVYGAPYSLEGIGLIANRSVFEAAGISLAGIGSYEDLLEALTDLRDQISEGALSEDFPQLEAVSDFAAGDEDYLATLAAELLLDGAFSSPAAAYAAPSLELPASEAAGGFFSLLARMSPHRGNWAGLTDTSRSRMAEGGLATERVAVILESTEVYRRIYGVNPALEGKLVFLPVYFADAERGAAYVGAPAWWALRAESGEEVKAQAADFLDWLYRTPEGGEVLAKELGALSPYRDTAVSTGVALHSGLLSAIERGEARPRLASAAPSGWGGEAFAAELREYFTVYSKEWSEAAQVCRDEWRDRRAGQARD